MVSLHADIADIARPTMPISDYGYRTAASAHSDLRAGVDLSDIYVWRMVSAYSEKPVITCMISQQN